MGGYSFKTMISLILLIIYMAIVASDHHHVADAAISCGQVASNVAPCIPYGTGSSSTPSIPCCSGVKTLNSAAQTTPDRQTVCNCLKTISASIPNINYKAVESLPTKCGVNIPYKISPSTDCKSVK